MCIRDRIFYILLAIACVLSVLARRSKAGPLVLWVTMAGSVGVVLMTAWLHMKESEIQHPNIRLGPGTEAEIIPPDLDLPKVTL